VCFACQFECGKLPSTCCNERRATWAYAARPSPTLSPPFWRTVSLVTCHCLKQGLAYHRVVHWARLVVKQYLLQASLRCSTTCQTRHALATAFLSLYTRSCHDSASRFLNNLLKAYIFIQHCSPFLQYHISSANHAPPAENSSSVHVLVVYTALGVPDMPFGYCAWHRQLQRQPPLQL